MIIPQLDSEILIGNGPTNFGVVIASLALVPLPPVAEQTVLVNLG